MRYDSLGVEQSEGINEEKEEKLAFHIWLLQYHIDRLRGAALAHGWTKAAHFEAEGFSEACKAAVDVFPHDAKLEPFACKVGGTLISLLRGCMIYN
jgi:pyrroloquinoline quinone (PQQ) biosynthesis protein C